MDLDSRWGLNVIGIAGIIFRFAMATPVRTLMGVVFSVLIIVSLHMVVNVLVYHYWQKEAYMNGESDGSEIVHGFVWNVVLTVTCVGLAKGIEKGLARGAERYLTKIMGERLAGGLLSEGASPTGLVRAVKNMKTLGYTDDFIRELADNISAEQLIRMNRMNRKGLGKDLLDILFGHSRQLGSYSDDLIWQLERSGRYTDDILKLVDHYGETFTKQIGADDLSRLGRLVKEGLADDVVDAVIKHADHFGDYSDDTIKKIAESGCNAERILTQIDDYAKDFTEELTAGQLKRLDDILEQGVTPEQFEVLVKHGQQLENYTDEIVTLWRNYDGNGDDFLKLVDEFGDVFVEGYQKNGEIAKGYLTALDRDFNSVEPTKEGLEIIINHLSGDFEEVFNNAMIDRIRKALNAGKELKGPDAEFYLHELEETKLMEQGYDYDTAHNMSLNEFGVTELDLYHPQVIKDLSKWFGIEWYEYWGIRK